MGYAVRMKLPLLMVPTEDTFGWPADSRFALAEERIGKLGSEREGRRAFVLDYLAAFGPASVQDAQAASGFAALTPEFAALEKPGELLRLQGPGEGASAQLFDLVDAPRPPAKTAAPARLLPEFDSSLLAHRDRARIVPPAHRAKVSLPGLRIPATFLLDGFVAGTWAVEGRGAKATITFQPFDGPSEQARSDRARGGGRAAFVHGPERLGSVPRRDGAQAAKRLPALPPALGFVVHRFSPLRLCSASRCASTFFASSGRSLASLPVFLTTSLLASSAFAQTLTVDGPPARRAAGRRDRTGHRTGRSPRPRRTSTPRRTTRSRPPSPPAASSPPATASSSPAPATPSSPCAAGRTPSARPSSATTARARSARRTRSSPPRTSRGSSATTASSPTASACSGSSPVVTTTSRASPSASTPTRARSTSSSRPRTPRSGEKAATTSSRTCARTRRVTSPP